MGRRKSAVPLAIGCSTASERKGIMKVQNGLSRWMLFLGLAMLSLMYLGPAQAASAEQLKKESAAALEALYSSTPAAKALSEKAKGILVFPDVTKAGLIVGGQGGDGVLYKHGKVAGYYNTAAVSVGLQAGAQSFGYAMFFMSDKVLKDFENSKGWEIGVGPSVVFIDTGMGKEINTETMKADIYGFIFDQKGLMAGVGVQGSKITKIKR